MVTDLSLLSASITDLHWLQEHSQRIVKKHEGEFVAIKNKKISASAPSNDILIKRLREKKIDVDTVIIQFIPHKNHLIIF